MSVSLSAKQGNAAPTASHDVRRKRNPIKLCFAAVALALLAFASTWIDGDLSNWFNNLDLPGDLRKALNLSEAFAHGFGAAAILGAVMLGSDRRRDVWLAIAITLCSGLVANGLKAGFVRIRPHSVDAITVQSTPPALNLEARGSSLPPVSEELQKSVVAPDFWDARQRSFPSGHAATACGLAIGLTRLFPALRFFLQPWPVSLAANGLPAKRTIPATY